MLWVYCAFTEVAPLSLFSDSVAKTTGGSRVTDVSGNRGRGQLRQRRTVPHREKRHRSSQSTNLCCVHLQWDNGASGSVRTRIPSSQPERQPRPAGGAHSFVLLRRTSGLCSGSFGPISCSAGHGPPQGLQNLPERPPYEENPLKGWTEGLMGIFKLLRSCGKTIFRYRIKCIQSVKIKVFYFIRK